MKKRYIKWLWQISVGMRKGIIVPLILNFFAVMLSLLFVEITRILMGGEYEGDKCLLLYIILLVVVKLIQIAFEQGEMYIREITSAKMDNALSLRTINSIFSCNIYDEQKIHSGDEMSRITVDVSMVAQLITYTLPFMLYALIQLIATSVYLLFVQPSLTLIILSIMPFVLVVGNFYTKKMVPISIDIRTNDSNIKQYVQEHLQHYELINTLGQTHSVLNTIRKFQSTLYAQLKSRAKVNVVSETTIDIGFVLGFLSIFIWGIYGINNHTFTYAQLVVFMQLTGQLQRPFVLFKEQYPTLVSSYASIDRLLAIDDMPHEDLSEPIIINGNIGLSFSNVSYKYANESNWIYKNFSYEFVPGSATAVLGPTGSGKSTMFKLILSIVNPTSGTIHIYNNNNEKHIVKASTRCNCIYVPQGNNIISGTIRYNLLLGKENATEEEMFNALYTATAEFVVSEFPNGLDTKVGEGGLGISEGQAQRISIARGLLQSGGILLLDEPTSALDSETERIFMERLISNCKKTIIIITHRTEISRYVSNVLTIKRNDTSSNYKELSIIGTYKNIL